MAEEIHVTRQQIEVLGNEDGNVHVTRQLIEVLGSPYIIGDSEDDLALEDKDEAGVIVVYNRTLDDTLTGLSGEEAEYGFVYSVAVDDTLTGLSDGAEYGFVYSRSVDDTLVGFDVDVAEYVWVRSGSAEDTLGGFETDTAEYTKIIGGLAEDTIAFSGETAERIATFNRGVDDTIDLGDETATVEVIYDRQAEDTVELSGETAEVGRVVSQSATDTLTGIGDEEAESGFIYTESIEDTLVVFNIDEAEYVRIRSAPAEDTLEGFDDDTATCVKIFGGIAEDQIDLDSLGQDAAIGNSIRGRCALDNLNLQDTAGPGFRRLTATDLLQRVYTGYDPETYEPIITYLGLQDEASVAVTYNTPKVSTDSVNWSEQASCIRIKSTAISVSAEDTLVLTEELHRALDCDDTLVLDDEAEVEVSKRTSDELELSDTGVVNVIRSRGASDEITLSEGVMWYNALEDFLCVYHPFVGTGPASNPTPPPVELEGPILGVTVPFQLLYPAVGPFTDTLMLRTPNLGNRDRFQMNRISRETRGGTLVVFADPMWPKIQTLVLNFSGLTWVEASGLHTFMDAHLGQEIGVLDWEHRFWGGVITKLDDPIVQDGRGCKYSVGFEFEGELAEYLP